MSLLLEDGAIWSKWEVCDTSILDKSTDKINNMWTEQQCYCAWTDISISLCLQQWFNILSLT